MPYSFAKVKILGYAGGDPTFQILPSGLTLAKFSIATSSTQKNKQTGNFEPATHWFHVIAYEKLAEQVRDFVHKGDRLMFEGRLVTRNWIDRKSNERRTVVEIVLVEFIVINSKTGMSAAEAAFLGAPHPESQQPPDYEPPPPDECYQGADSRMDEPF